MESEENRSEENISNKIAVSDIIRSSLQGRKKLSPEVCDLIIEKAEENYFENHQTSGSLRKVAKEIVQMCAGQGKGNED
jgi:hypothetical protein